MSVLRGMNPKQVLEELDDWFLHAYDQYGHDFSSQRANDLFSILSALRGPDVDDTTAAEAIKEHSTAHIRAIALPHLGPGWGKTENADEATRALRAVKEGARKPEALLHAPGHFYTHFEWAVDALSHWGMI